MSEAEGQVEVQVVEEVIPRENDLEGQKMLDQALEDYEKKLKAIEAKRAKRGQGEDAAGGSNEKELEVVEAATSKEHGAEQGQEEGAAAAVGSTPGPSRGSRTKEEQMDDIRRIKAMTKALTSLLPEWEDDDVDRFQRACKSVEQELKELGRNRELGRDSSVEVQEEDDEEEEEASPE